MVVEFVGTIQRLLSILDVCLVVVLESNKQYLTMFTRLQTRNNASKKSQWSKKCSNNRKRDIMDKSCHATGNQRPLLTNCCSLEATAS